MKKYVILIILLVSISVSQEILDGIAAIVGENIILKSDIDQFARMNASQMGINPANDIEKWNELKRQSLQALIDENILLEQAKIETIEVKDRDVEMYLDQQINDIIRQTGSVEKAEEILGKSLPKIKMDYRYSIRNRLIVQNLRSTKFSKIKISRREVENFYETYKDSIPEIPPSLDFSNILIEIKPGNKENTRAYKLIDSLRTLLIDGKEDFDKLAKKYSQDPGSAVAGGDLGYINRGDFVTKFEEVAFSLKDNEISKIVKTEFGYHIIQFIDRKGEKINVRHILIIPEISEQNKIDTKNFIDDLYAKILNNEISFDSAAFKYSDDTDSKINMGRISRIQKNQIKNKKFISVMDNLEIGQISEVFQTDLGYHILRLNNIYDDSWVIIKNYALEKKKNDMYLNWIEELRSKFFIDKKVDY